MFSGFLEPNAYIQTKVFILSQIGPVLPPLLLLFFYTEWIGRENQYAIQCIGRKWARPVRYLFYYLIIIAIFSFVNKEKEFIYFQF
jgi:hypothetical protein